MHPSDKAALFCADRRDRRVLLTALCRQVVVAEIEFGLIRQREQPLDGAPQCSRIAAREIGAGFTLDPTITPHLNGDRSILALNISREDLNLSLIHI